MGLTVALLFSGLTFAGSPADAAIGTTLTVNTTADIGTGAGACGNSADTTVPSPLSLREATCLANNIGGAVTINVPVGHYTLLNGELQPGLASGQNITIAGAGSASTIIDGNNAGRIFDIDMNLAGGVTTSISGVTLTNGSDSTFGGGAIFAGQGDSAATADVLTVSDSAVTNNDAIGWMNSGGGIQMFGGALTLTNTTFSANTVQDSGSGVYYTSSGPAAGQSLTVTNSTFTSNTATPVSATAGAFGGALAVMDASTSPGTTMQVSNSRFINNSVSGSTGTNQAAGAAILENSGNLAVTGSTFTSNTVSGTDSEGAAVAAFGTLTMHNNRIVANTGAAAVHSPNPADAADNWWGCNGGANATGCDTTSGSVTATPYLKLTATASPDHVTGPNGTATITGSLLTDSAGTTVAGSDLGAFDTLPLTFADPAGDATVTTNTGAHTAAISNGVASIDYHSNTTTGPDNVSVSFDNATTAAALEVDQAPSITSSDSATFKTGTAGTFTVTTAGYPAPALTEAGGLPAGISFTDNGDGTATIAGTPTDSGDFTLNVSASNGTSPDATQALTLHVGQPPAFTSPATATFKVGESGTFGVTTSGVPSVSTITESGALPAGVAFTDNGNGTASLSGTPTGTGGTYPVTLTASSGLSPDATQALTIQVNQAPSVTTNPTDQNVSPVASVTFSAAADGVPTPTVQWQRSTDGGTSFTNVAGATSTSYTFTTSTGDNANQYRAVFTNTAGSATTTAATLSVGTAPSFTSADTTRFLVGQASSFTASVSGVPTPTFSSTGMPGWLTLTDNGTGTATLSGTPPAGSGGSYTFTLTAANGFLPPASQSFTLFVDESPTITSPDHVTFKAGSAGTFAVTTTAGYPTATTLSETGALPLGVSFVDNGDGTAVLSGTPTTGTGGSYAITISATATGGTATSATQAFTLTVNEPVSISSADHATFKVGTAGSFTVTTTAGSPATTTLAKTGALPTGVSFTDNGDGTATLAGTPATGAGGPYSLTITASNGVAPDATQAFTLTVNEPASISSADHATLKVGTAGSFTVTTTAGYPLASTLTKTGALPTGVTFTDNGDGTATLAGTPAAGTSGSYPLTITASNGVVPDATQAFTLTVAKAAQTITITSMPPASALVGGSYTPTATSSSGLPVAVTLDAPGSAACALSGGKVTFTRAGSCVVDFNQSGDPTFAAAPQAQQSIDVIQNATGVTLTSSVSPSVYGQSVTVTASTTGATTGTVQFTVDGHPLGTPVTVTGGTATSRLDGLAVGTHQVRGDFTPADATAFASSSGLLTQVVDQAATSTGVVVHAHTITATVSPVAPGAGTPTGTVTFAMGGHSVGTASLVGGVASLGYTVPSDGAHTVAATYGGDSHFAASSSSTNRNNPRIRATVTSSTHRTPAGWYRTPVTIRFTCTPNGSPLVGPCPAPVTRSRNGAAQSVTRTIRTVDGGVATVVVSGINIDHTAPGVHATGVRNGHAYAHHPKIGCRAHDALSGIRTCTVTLHHHGATTRYVVVARDNAGNTARVTGRFATLGRYLDGAPRTRGVYLLKPGHTYTLVVQAGRRPVAYLPAPAPKLPHRRATVMHRSGAGVWTLGVTATRAMRSHPEWALGVRYRPAGPLHLLRFRVR